MSQQDWRRDPIWQLLGTIIATALALMTQFNDLTSKVLIFAAGIVICAWVYFGNEYLKRLFKHRVVTRLFIVVRYIVLLLLSSALVFFCLFLFYKADTVLGKIAAGAGCILAFSADTTAYHNEHPFIIGVLKYTGFLTGIVCFVLVFVVDNPWHKIILGIGAVFIEIITYIFFPDPSGGIRIPRAFQKKQTGADKSES